MSQLGAKRVLLVGMGGLGCPAALALAQAGVGRLTLVDPDLVELSNLHRQPWYRAGDVGRPKVEVARAHLRAAFPALEVAIRRLRVDEDGAASLIAAHHAAIDGTDDVRAKFVLSDAAVRMRTPLVYGGVLRCAGQAMLIAPGGPCLRCLFDEPQPGEEAPSCARAGVLGAVAGLVGALQASLAVSALQGERVQAGQLIAVDAWRMSSRTVSVRRASDCPTCATTKFAVPAGASGGACL